MRGGRQNSKDTLCSKRVQQRDQVSRVFSVTEVSDHFLHLITTAFLTMCQEPTLLCVDIYSLTVRLRLPIPISYSCI